MTAALRPERGMQEDAMTHNETVGGCHTTIMIGGSKNPDEWWEKKCVEFKKEDCKAHKKCDWTSWR